MSRNSFDMKARSKPTLYPPLPFHGIRAISGLCAVIVTGILAFFCHQLWADKFKIPWTFILLLLAALCTIAAMLLTSIINCCATLSPIFNILVNIPLIILWVFSFSLLTWNMYGALGHSCSITNWGNDRGVMVCQIYKTLYTFSLFGAMAQIAQIVVDIRARRKQLRRGKYDKMEEDRDIKNDDLKPLASNTIHDIPLSTTPTSNQQYRDDQLNHQQPIEQPQQQYHQQLQRQQSDYSDDNPGWRPGQRPAPPSHSQSYASSVYSSRRNDDRYHEYDSTTSLQMQDFSHQRSYQPAHYDSRSYQSGYGYPQDGHYQQSRY